MVFHFHKPDRKVVWAGGLIASASIAIIWWRRIRWRSKKNTAKMIDILQRPGVHIANPEHVESVINNLITDGPANLQVISDFDRTLSRFKKNGDSVETCYQVLDNSSILSTEYREKACKVRDIYYAIETDASLTIDQKVPYMVEWWTKAHDLLLDLNLSRSSLQDIVAGSNIAFRDGSEQMFQTLAQHQVPLLIFSAGIGDIIEEVIRQRATLHDNMRVVSNYMDFNAQGQLVGFQGELIHVFNKNESAIHKSDYFQRIKSRSNLMLLGDSLGDLRMSEGACNVQNILKIGFLNDKIEANLERYKEKFDIVLVSDETMDVANAIFSQVIS